MFLFSVLGEPVLYDPDLKLSKAIAKSVVPLTELMRSFVRTLDPSDDLIFYRFKSTKDEVLVAYDKNFSIISIQKKEDSMK